MPVLTSPGRFQESWPAATDSPPQDDSLTSLHWLQNFSILSADPERPTADWPHPSSSSQQLLFFRRRAGTESPCSPPAGDTAGMPLLPGSPITSGSASPRLPSCAHTQPQQQPAAEVDYKRNPKVKPPFSYASLICMAMQASQQPKVTLSTIYNWITDNFCYYRHAEPSWQNSIRHNLSLNKCFKKVPRQKDEPGKGGFWQIDPQYADMFVNGIFKRRRMSAGHYGVQRQSKPAQGYHQACAYQGAGGKRKLPPPQSHHAVRAAESPLLGTEGNCGGGGGGDFLRGELDLGSVFDEVLGGGGGGGSTFEDLDINVALSSLGCELEVSVQGRQHAAGMGRWCVGGEAAGQSHHQPYGYLVPNSLDELHLHGPQLIQQQQHFDEAAALFCDQTTGAGLQPWEEIKEEAQPVPLDPSFGLYDGFFTEMPAWERAESFL